MTCRSRGAAAGAEVMLAVATHVESRSAERLGGSGAAIAQRGGAHPRVIVPRRNGVAYALLQTDETGASSFVLPASTMRPKRSFPLTIAALGATRRTLRVLMWPVQPVLSAGAPAIAGAVGTAAPPEPARAAAAGGWPMAGARLALRLAEGAVLLLLHDTFSTPQAAFADWIGDASFAPVHRASGAGAWLSPIRRSPAASKTIWPGWWRISRSCPARSTSSRTAAAACWRAPSPPTAGLPLRRVCQVGTPNNGTPLAHDMQTCRDSSTATWPCWRALRPNVAQRDARGRVVHAAFRRRSAASPLPGIEALQPGSAVLRASALARASERSSGSRWVRSSRCRAATPNGSLEEFSSARQRSGGAERGLPRPGRPVADSLRSAASDVHHHNYFANAPRPRTARRAALSL